MKAPTHNPNHHQAHTAANAASQLLAPVCSCGHLRQAHKEDEGACMVVWGCACERYDPELEVLPDSTKAGKTKARIVALLAFALNERGLPNRPANPSHKALKYPIPGPFRVTSSPFTRIGHGSGSTRRKDSNVCWRHDATKPPARGRPGMLNRAFPDTRYPAKKVRLIFKNPWPEPVAMGVAR